MIQSCGRARPSNKPLYYELATCCKISSDNEIVDIFLPKEFCWIFVLRSQDICCERNFVFSYICTEAVCSTWTWTERGGIAPDLEVFFEAESVFVKESTWKGEDWSKAAKTEQFCLKSICHQMPTKIWWQRPPVYKQPRSSSLRQTVRGWWLNGRILGEGNQENLTREKSRKETKEKVTKGKVFNGWKKEATKRVTVP